MKLLRLTPFLAGALFLAACNREPTEPTLEAQLDLVDPYVLTFNATSGLPGEPFHAEGRPPSPHGGMGPGGRFPDSLRLTDAQKTAIQAAIAAFQTSHKADLDALQAIHQEARAAIQAGKTRAEVKAILEKAKPILERMRAAWDALHTAINNILTPAQRAWIESHKPDRPPPMPRPHP
ncbi:MAG TPA: Spy/CpxP family protein refolding chaperone [Gemmatimonadaceae bacterium]|nr:Spy/CpxP family protein refolding chaperone [Gemmatimonadaceae bacterium]